uniref:RxLR effector candidate protein n=1 Tax=Hyaloperonospora arabidopsidis (strain Emoy2) TaxID=559515 RepID=M4BXP6_HYAAE
MRFHGSLLLLLVAFVACLGTNSVAETSMRVNEVTQAIDVPSTEISHLCHACVKSCGKIYMGCPQEDQWVLRDVRKEDSLLSCCRPSR